MPHIRSPNPGTHPSQTRSPKHLALKPVGPGVLWGSEILLLRSSNTETYPGNQSKGSSLRGDWITHEANAVASLKASARGAGSIQGYPGAGEVLGNAILHSPPPSGCRGHAETGPPES